MEAEKYLVFSFKYNEEIYIDFYFDEKDTWTSFLEELNKLIHFESSSLKLKIFDTDRKDLISNYGNFFSPVNDVEISFYYERQYNLDSWKNKLERNSKKKNFIE